MCTLPRRASPYQLIITVPGPNLCRRQVVCLLYVSTWRHSHILCECKTMQIIWKWRCVWAFSSVSRIMQLITRNMMKSMWGQHKSQIPPVIRVDWWRSVKTFLVHLIFDHKKKLSSRQSALLTTEHCFQKIWRQKLLCGGCSCLYDRVGVPRSLYGQVCHSESAHSLHCGAGSGPHQVRAGRQGASWIKTVAANRKWAC